MARIGQFGIAVVSAAGTMAALGAMAAGCSEDSSAPSEPAGQGGTSGATYQTERPNVVVFLSDDLRADVLESYQGVGIPTPNIDALAATGMRFERAYAAAAMCTPSRFGILTGQHASRCQRPDCFTATGSGEPVNVQWDAVIADPARTLAHYLGQHGYHTGFVGKWHTGRPSSELGLPELTEDADLDDPAVDQALAERHAMLAAEIRATGGFDFAGSVLWENWPVHPVAALRNHNFEWMTYGAMTFLESAPRDRPFFLFVATTAIHGPGHPQALDHDERYTAEGRFEEPFGHHPDRATIATRLADAGVAADHLGVGLTMMDDQVGVITNRLREMGVEDNTLFVFLADHGTEPGKATCYEQGTHTPMIVRWPGQVEAGSTSEALVQTVDLVPTILDAVDVSADTRELDGESFAPVLAGGAPTDGRYLYFEGGLMRGVTDGQYRYVAYRLPQALIDGMQDGTISPAPNHMNLPDQEQPFISAQSYAAYFDPDQLYELSSDPYEQNNLAGDPAYADVLQELQGAMRAWVDRLDQGPGSDHPFPLDDAATVTFMQSPEYQALTAPLLQQAVPDWWPGGWPTCDRPNFCPEAP